MQRYLSVREVANILSISMAATYALFKRKDFPKIEVGHRLLVAEDRLESWLSDGGTHGEPLTK